MPDAPLAEPDFIQARTEAHRRQGDLERLRLRIHAGELIDIGRLAIALHNFGRQRRDVLLALPGQLAREIASRYGADEHALLMGLTNVVDEEIRQISGSHGC